MGSLEGGGQVQFGRDGMEYNFIVCAPMQEKSEVSCSCIGNLFAPHEKLFLVRKKELEETDPSISRRANKSSELKNESEGKPQKKSLRKRNLSNFSAENSAPNTPNDPSRPEEARTHFGHDEPHLAFPRVEQHVFSAATFMPHPATTRHVDSPHKQKSYNPFGEQANYRPQPSPQFFPAPSRTLILQPTPRHSPSLTPQGAHMGRQPIGLAYLEEQPLEGYQLGLREGGESWMRREESLLIEDFDRLFSRDDALLEEKPARVREAQRSRRYQKQQLVGRLAESDDDAASDAHSQVIGKGFDSHFHDFWEEGSNAKETFGSRTTNTKLSQLQRNAENMEMHCPEAHPHERNRFGTSVNYKSYKFL